MRERKDSKRERVLEPDARQFFEGLYLSHPLLFGWNKLTAADTPETGKVFWFVVRWTPHSKMPQYVAGPYESEADATAASRMSVMAGSVVTIMGTVPQEVLLPITVAPE